ncbi:RNA polymerase subunit AC19 [Rhizoclosmatium sp. JEL0117]|nr:RNA polymerase subunit AC19 [Rhizoclosmatium sp. JEL0117]
MTPWVTGGAAATLSATIQITCNAATNTTKIVPVPAPSQAGTYSGVSTAQVLDQTLLPSLTLSTSVNAAVFWGASVAPTLDYIPTGYTPIRFAGYLDSGAWFIAFTPTTASITSGTPPAITFTTPEMAFDQVPGGVNGVPLNQITGIAFDPVSKTSSQFFPSSLNTNPGPPQITMALSMALSNPAFFMLLQANVNQGIGVSVNVQWGQVQYLGSWQSRTFNYPYAKYGTMSMTVTSAVDLQIVVLNTCATTWVPGGAAKFDCFTISATTTSAATVSVSVSLGYVWNSNLNADYNYVTPTQIAWCRFISALDGGSWDSTLSGKPNVAGGFVNVTATGTQLGQWAQPPNFPPTQTAKMAMVEPTEGVGVPHTEGPKVEILKGDYEDPTSVTFVLKDEDHTLGNSLRYLLMKNPSVSFCGYSLPHPSEYKVNLRIQTDGSITAVQALHKALDDLTQLCEHVQSSFVEKFDEGNFAIEEGADQ